MGGNAQRLPASVRGGLIREEGHRPGRVAPSLFTDIAPLPSILALKQFGEFFVNQPFLEGFLDAEE